MIKKQDEKFKDLGQTNATVPDKTEAKRGKDETRLPLVEEDKLNPEIKAHEYSGDMNKFKPAEPKSKKLRFLNSIVNDVDPANSIDYRTFIRSIQGKNSPNRKVLMDLLVDNSEYFRKKFTRPSEFNEYIDKELTLEEEELSKDHVYSILEAHEVARGHNIRKQNEEFNLEVLIENSPANQEADIREVYQTAERAVKTSREISEKLFNSVMDLSWETDYGTFKSQWGAFFSKYFDYTKEDQTSDNPVRYIGELFNDVYKATQPVERINHNLGTTMLNIANFFPQALAFPGELTFGTAVRIMDRYKKEKEKKERTKFRPFSRGPSIEAESVFGLAEQVFKKFQNEMARHEGERIPAPIIGAPILELFNVAGGLGKWGVNTANNLLLSEQLIIQPMMRQYFKLLGYDDKKIEATFEEAEMGFYSRPMDGAFVTLMAKGVYSKGLRMNAQRKLAKGNIRKPSYKLVKDFKTGGKKVKVKKYPEWEIKVASEVANAKYQDAVNSQIIEKKIKGAMTNDYISFKEAFDMAIKQTVKSSDIKKYKAELNRMRDGLERHYKEIYPDLMGSRKKKLPWKYTRTGAKFKKKKIDADAKRLKETADALIEEIDYNNRFGQSRPIPENMTKTEFKRFFEIEVNLSKKNIRKHKKKFDNLYKEYLKDGSLTDNQLRIEMLKVTGADAASKRFEHLSIDKAFKNSKELGQSIKTGPSKHGAIIGMFHKSIELMRRMYPDNKDLRGILDHLEKKRSKVPEKYLKGYDLWHGTMAKFGKDALNKLGIHIDFKKRMKANLENHLEKLRDGLETIEKGESKMKEARLKKQKNRIDEVVEAIGNIDELEYMHINTAMWLTEAAKGNNLNSLRSGLKIINGKRRKNISFQKMKEDGLIVEDANVLDMLAGYGAGTARDIPVADIINKSLKSGHLVSLWTKTKKGKRKISLEELKKLEVNPHSKVPKTEKSLKKLKKLEKEMVGKNYIYLNKDKGGSFHGYAVSKKLYPYLTRYSRKFDPNTDVGHWINKHISTYMKATKFMQFANPTIMLQYDATQALFAGTFDNLFVPPLSGLGGYKVGAYTGEVLANAVGGNSAVGRITGGLIGGATGLGLGAWKTRKNWKAQKRGLKSWYLQDKNFYQAEFQGTFSNPIMQNLRSFERSVDAYKTHYGTTVSKKLSSVTKESFNRFKQADSKGKIYMLGDESIGNVYRTMFHTTWMADKGMRMMTREYFISQGHSPRKASQLAAKVHGDYASVPRHTGEYMNKFLFTPTFKVAMGDMLVKTAKGIFNFKDPGLQKAYGGFAARMAGFYVGIDYLYTHMLGFDRISFSRTYSKDMVDSKGIMRRFVLNSTNPHSFYWKNGEVLGGFLSGVGKNLLHRLKDEEIPYPVDYGEFAKQAFNRNYYEIHPVFRNAYSAFFKPLEHGIYNELDSPSTKIKKQTAFLAYSHFRILDYIQKKPFDNKRRWEATKMLERNFNPAQQMMLKYLRYYYDKSDKTYIESMKLLGTIKEGIDKFDVIYFPEDLEEYTGTKLGDSERALHNFGESMFSPDNKLYRFMDEQIEGFVDDMRYIGLDKFKEYIPAMGERDATRNPDEINMDDLMPKKTQKKLIFNEKTQRFEQKK